MPTIAPVRAPCLARLTSTLRMSFHGMVAIVSEPTSSSTDAMSGSAPFA